MRHADFGGRVKLRRNGKEGGFVVVTGRGGRKRDLFSCVRSRRSTVCTFDDK